MIWPALFFTVVSIITRFTSTRMASWPVSCAASGIAETQATTAIRKSPRLRKCGVRWRDFDTSIVAF